MEIQDAGHGLVILFGDATQFIRHMNAFDDQDLAFLLDLTHRFGSEAPIACVDAARLQRAPEGPGQSPGRGRNEVIERCGIRRKIVHVDAIVLGHLTVHTERDVLIASRQPCLAYWASHPLDLHHRPDGPGCPAGTRAA